MSHDVVFGEIQCGTEGITDEMESPSGVETFVACGINDHADSLECRGRDKRWGFCFHSGAGYACSCGTSGTDTCAGGGRRW